MTEHHDHAPHDEEVEFVPRPEMHGRLSNERLVARAAFRFDQKYGEKAWKKRLVGQKGKVEILVRSDRVNGYQRNEE